MNSNPIRCLATVALRPVRSLIVKGFICILRKEEMYQLQLFVLANLVSVNGRWVERSHGSSVL